MKIPGRRDNFPPFSIYETTSTMYPVPFRAFQCNKDMDKLQQINAVPPLHGRNLSTCAVRRGCRSWACTAWRKNGFCGTQQQPARADREKTNSSPVVVGGQETLSLDWGSDTSETLFHRNHSRRVELVAQKYFTVSILRDLQGQTCQNSEQSHLTLELKLLWVRGWTRHIPRISQWYLWNDRAVKTTTD